MYEGGCNCTLAATTTLIVLHEVDDVQRWLSSPKRSEVFGPLGITFRTFVDPENPNRVGGLVEVPDMAVSRNSCRVQRPPRRWRMTARGLRPWWSSSKADEFVDRGRRSE